MSLAACCSGFVSLTRAAARFAGAIARRAGAGSVHPDWAARAALCERCPIRVGVGRVSYCGQPLHRKPNRDQADDGCGCPTREKARDPSEHCPLNGAHRAAQTHPDRCDCKWCASTAAHA
jgi:hypothetical protein